MVWSAFEVEARPAGKEEVGVGDGRRPQADEAEGEADDAPPLGVGLTIRDRARDAVRVRVGARLRGRVRVGTRRGLGLGLG